MREQTTSLFEDIILSFKDRIQDEQVRELVFLDVLRIFKDQCLLQIFDERLRDLDDAFMRAYDVVFDILDR